MSQNIKNNLFRFVTLRSPQLIDEKDKQFGFVYYPDESTGEFIPSMQSASESEKKQTLLDRKDNFRNTQTPFEKKSDVKSLNENLYNFSSWLMRNKNALSYAAIVDNLNSAESFANENDLLKVWDNLIYQTLSKSSVYVREALIQMLVANQFLEAFEALPAGLTEFTSKQDKEFTRRAHASVVIPKDVLLKTYNTEPIKTKTKGLRAEDQKRLCDLLTTKYNKLALKQLADELKTLKTAYDTSEAASYKTALENHQSAVDTIKDNGSVQLVNQWDVETQAYIQVERFVHDPLPEFSYQKAVEIDPQDLQTALSDLSEKCLIDHKLDTLTSYDAILKAVKQLLKEKSNKAEQLLPKTGKSVLKGGAAMRLEDPFKAALTNFGDVDAYVEQMIEDNVSADTIPLTVASEIDPKQLDPSTCYAVSLSARATGTISGNRDWMFRMGITYNNEYSPITAVDQALSFTNDATVINSTSFEIEQTAPHHSKLGLFFDLGFISKPDTVGNPILSGTITLANGDTLDFSETITMYPDRKELAGTEFLDFECEEEEEPEKPETFGKTYGVTNLGIADFRRVEQEVCCYVPGEVSHIENVMAREYKERSTRSLTSSEFTTEKTDERERENLTDTTSTERNEMQSEVASVLNEDRSQSSGGNASVHGGGDKWGFSAGAHFDSASSSSSSNSNSQAQTYAQEVTERAMERIVQKTQTKRTSRILKEFEENNSHGFDNRKGESHVTGVYRWVDKIYKNTLINYGKRLMYEFAIPEPSKFFQEAVWKQFDATGQVESGVLLPEMPVHPSALGLTNPSVINPEGEDNDTEVDYQQLAAVYNAEVNSQPAQTIVLSKAFKIEYSGGTDRDESNSISDSIEITEGYETKQGKIKGRVFAHSTHGDNARVTISVGDNIGGEIDSGDHRNLDFEITEDELGNIRNELAVSASAYDMAACSFNVAVTCKRTPELLEQWQNETYNAIMEAYYDRMQEYNDAIREQEANRGLTPEQERLSFNPLLNKSIMLRELKRVAIELLIAKTRISINNFGDIDEDTGVSAVKRGEAFQTHASTVKFFEQAFDWDIMAYVFYPYFYTDEKDWKKLFQSQDAADPLFQAFLQSGMARTVVPVRPGFEHAINWYMTTGEIWNGKGMVVDQDDDLYVSIAEEMETIQGIVEGTWETRLPTALTMLQAGSIGLNLEGLPCNVECDDHLLFDTDGNPVLDENGEQVSKNPISQNENLIGGAEGPDGVGADYDSEPITVE